MMRRLFQKLFTPADVRTDTERKIDRTAEWLRTDPMCGRRGGNCQCQQLMECRHESPPPFRGAAPIEPTMTPNSIVDAMRPGVPYSRADAAEALRTDYVKTGRGVVMMIDAEFIVWRKSQRGPPIPSLDMFDPRRSMDWNAIKERHIAIRTLTDDDRILTFEEIIAKYPCPAQSEIE